MVSIEPENLTEYIVVEYRWVLVMLALLPLSALWKLWSSVRSYVVFKLNSAPRMHDRKVRDVQKQVKSWLAGDRSSRLCTARPSWQTMCFRHGTYKKTFTNISINLVDVLEVDTENMTVRCEPLVTMGQLSRTLEPLGLALAVVPELDQLTVGGLVMGTGVESSSHVHGLFQHICLQYELVLADGSVVTCSKDENPDLFYAVPWSYGTLGFLTSAVIKVVPAKKYVRLEYHPYTNLTDLSARFRQECLAKKPHQFIEALLYTKDSGVLMLGDMADEVGNDGKFNPIGKWYSEWFFIQVRKFLTSYEQGREQSHVQYIPLRDYYHRHTKSFFWELQDIVPFGNSIIFRYLFGWLMPPEVSLLKLTQPEAVTKLYDRAHVIQDMLVPIEHLEKSVLKFHEEFEVRFIGDLLFDADLTYAKAVTKLYDRAHVIQDMLVPIEHLEKSVLKFHEEFEVYPIWMCPFKVFKDPGQLRVKTPDAQMFVDIGVYGVPKAKGFETVSSTRRIESFVTQHDGFQMLYADTYTTLEEFRRMFDHTLYDRVRDTLPYCKDAFPEIYGKVNRSVRK